MKRKAAKLTKYLLFGFAMLVMFLMLYGCSGSDGGVGPKGDPGASVTGPPGPPGADAGTNAANMNTETMAALNPVITVDSVTINSKPVVKFTVKNPRGVGIKGLGFATQSTVPSSSGTLATVPTLSYFSFNLAKLVPANAATGAPSKWVSYLVTTVPTKTTAGVAVPSVPTRPSTDAQGTLVDNGDGSYTYTFYRDIAKIKDEVAAATETATNKNADLGDLTYDPTATHRLVIRFTGTVRGTGTNTADGTSSGVTAVLLENPKLIIHDFVPSPYKVVAATDTQRMVTTNEACKSCHFTFPGHRGGDARNCVMCHNDQIKYGRAKTTSALAAGTYSSSTPPAETTVLKTGTTNVFETTTGLIPGTMGVTGTKTATISTTEKDPLTGEYTTTTRYTPAAYVVDGETLGDFPIMIHKLHFGNLLNTAGGRWNGGKWRGSLLKKTGFGYNLMGYYAFQDMREYPLSVMNCKKCHVGDTAAQLAAAPQANNWKTKPSRVACGSCHDGINWTTGGGTTLGNVKALGAPYAGHLGGPATDDSLCAKCHPDASIKHITDTSTPLNPEVPSDMTGQAATIFRYYIKEVTVDEATRYPTVEFKITKQVGTTTATATNVTLNTPAAASAGASPGVDGTGSAAFYLANYGTASGGLITGFSGGPSFMIHWSMTGGVDFDNLGALSSYYITGQPGATGRFGVWLADLATGTGGKLSGPDPDGYYKAVLKSANAHEAGRNLLGITVSPATGAITPGQTRDQKIPTGAKLVAVQMAGNFTQRNLGAPYTGGLAIPSPSVVKAVSKMERRSVFNMAKCQACHEAGYGNETDGGGHVTPGDFAGCVTCHNPMMAGNGLDPTAQRGPASYSAKTPYGWNFGPLMHNKHLEANKMGNLNQCEMCHFSGTYSSVPTGAQPTTSLAGDFTTMPVPPLYTVNKDTDLITSPYAAACLSCHTNADAANHAKVNGALVNQARSLGGGAVVGGLTTFVSGESCGTCHGVGKAYDVEKIHAEISGD